jgi:hypothetical protein
MIPQIDDRIIKAGATLAPFAKREKPQLFSRLDASFIRKVGVHQQVTRHQRAVVASNEADPITVGGKVMPVSIGF